MKTTFSEVLKILTKEKGITITEVAERLGISQSWLSGLVLYKDIPMKRVEEIFLVLGEKLTLTNGDQPSFSDYKITIDSYRSLLESTGRELEIKLSNGKKYKL